MLCPRYIVTFAGWVRDPRARAHVIATIPEQSSEQSCAGITISSPHVSIPCYYHVIITLSSRYHHAPHRAQLRSSNTPLRPHSAHTLSQYRTWRSTLVVRTLSQYRTWRSKLVG
eukprot:2363169-Rhodomonas_salina.2